MVVFTAKGLRSATLGTSTYSIRAVGGGIGVLSSRNPSRCSSMASRILSGSAPERGAYVFRQIDWQKILARIEVILARFIEHTN